MSTKPGDFQIGFQGLKTELSERTIPVHPLLEAAVKWWRETGWALWVGRTPRDEDLIFPNAEGKPWRPRSAKLFREDLVAAGLPDVFEPSGKPFRFHNLRGTFSTFLASEDVPGDLRAALLGHAPVSTEDGFYSHKMLAKLRQAVEVIVFPFTWADLVGGSGPVARPSLEQSLEQSAAHAPN